MFSIFDHQTGDYMNTARNSNTKQECINEFYPFATEDTPEEELRGIEDKESVIRGMDYSIEEHANPV